jgi:hypothetical protein
MRSTGEHRSTLLH